MFNINLKNYKLILPYLFVLIFLIAGWYLIPNFLPALIVFILILGVLVFVHELGHFIAAKYVGIKVEEFAIGMGTIVYSREYKGTLYSLRALPIGGYVQMYGEGEYDIESPDSYSAKSPIQRLLVLVAGVAMNFFLAVLLLYLFAFNVNFQFRTFDTIFGSEYNPIFGTKIEQKPFVISLSNDSVLSNKDVQDFDIITHIDDEDIYLYNFDEKILAKNGQTVRLTFLDFESSNTKTINVEIPKLPENHFNSKNQSYVVINSFLADSVLKDKLEEGDIIVDINGQEYDPKEFSSIIRANKGKEINLQYISASDPSNEVKTIKIKLPDKEYPLGIRISTLYRGSTLLGVDISGISFIQFNGYERFFVGFMQAFNLVHQFFLAFGKIFVQSFEQRDVMPIASNLGGAISIFEIIRRILTTFGFWGIIEIMILFSLNLAVLNILPIPALDGGHILFNIIEIITRKRLPSKVYNYITNAGFIFLLTLMIVVVVFDLFKFTNSRYLCNSINIPFLCELPDMRE
ncbi:MAG: RIP metalloprotease RseP [Candidatus Dojkabacteria bacterium]|nr:RIP metalloprotease RseP [Candidatus Dojkabacteria bacterium]